MSNSHDSHPLENPFGIPLNTAVYVCCHVLQQTNPILFASHDQDGDWQFLCDSEHQMSDIALSCLGCLLSQDPSLSLLAKMRPREEATREEGQPWRISDPNEDTINQNVQEYGWHAALIEASEEEPAFAYSIGFYQTYKQPEVILFGLPHDLMHQMLGDYERMIKSGEPPTPGERISSMLEGYDCIFRTVEKKHYKRYLGYGRWFYKGDEFPVLQCLWPDKQGLFPWAPNCHPRLKEAQPLLFPEE